MKKVWLDDIRPAPNGWEWATTADAAIAFLSYEEVAEISLDHDLGLNEPTGLVVARFIAGMKNPPIVRIHSMNPVGAKAMRDALEIVRK